MFGKKKKTKQTKKRNFNTNHHFVFVEAPFHFVAHQALLWQDAPWWPASCPMKFIKETEGEVQVGTRYTMKVKRPLGPKWKAEITDIRPNRLLERTFIQGMFEGRESIRAEERANGTRIDYYFHCRVKGPINKIFWILFFRKKHDANIDAILKALRDYCLKVPQTQNNGHDI